MNDCTHHKSLVPINECKEYFCIKCGWKFKITHVVDTELELFLKDKYGIVEGSHFSSILEEAILTWAKNKEKQ